MNPGLTLFPIADYWAHLQGVTLHLSLTGLTIFGFLVGALTGFFGIGGRLLTAPLLNILFNIPFNVAVGSDICQMMGTSTSNMLRFKRMNRIDFTLAGWMLIGTVAGMEGGARILEFLKNTGALHLFHWSISFLTLSMTLVYSVLLLWIGAIIYREAKASQQEGLLGGGVPPYQPAMTARLQHIQLPPMIALPVSGIEAISLWVVLGVGLATGLLVGLLGSGGVFIRMPALVYVIGCPMVVAIGTDLLESIFSIGFGVLSHSLKGNIDFVLMFVLLITGSLGNQVGSVLAKRTTNPLVRQGFAYIAFMVVILLLGKLVI
jgi:uncharacterized protein